MQTRPWVTSKVSGMEVGNQVRGELGVRSRSSLLAMMRTQAFTLSHSKTQEMMGTLGCFCQWLLC